MALERNGGTRRSRQKSVRSFKLCKDVRMRVCERQLRNMCRKTKQERSPGHHETAQRVRAVRCTRGWAKQERRLGKVPKLHVSERKFRRTGAAGVVNLRRQTRSRQVPVAGAASAAGTAVDAAPGRPHQAPRRLTRNHAQQGWQLQEWYRGTECNHYLPSFGDAEY